MIRIDFSYNIKFCIKLSYILFKKKIFVFETDMQIPSINYNYKSGYPVSFRGDKLSLNSLRSLKDIDCPYCGHTMLTLSEIFDYAKKAEKLKGVSLAKFLVSLQPDMKPNEKKAACMIKEELKRHPHADLKEILNIMYPKHIERLEHQQEKVLLELQKIAVDFPEHDKKLTLEYINQGLEAIRNRDSKRHFKRNKYISQFFKLSERYEDFGNYLKIINAIKSMPNTYMSIDAFIVKYSRKSSFEIAARLLMPSVITIEHLLPRSCGGTNNLTNVVAACGNDNSTRRSQPLDTMTGLSTNLPYYFQTLRKASSKKFPQHELTRVEEYIQGVKVTINNLLKNGLNISDPSQGRYF